MSSRALCELQGLCELQAPFQPHPFHEGTLSVPLSLPAILSDLPCQELPSLPGPFLTHLLPAQPGVSPSSTRTSPDTGLSPAPPSQGHHGCRAGTARTGVHQLPSIRDPSRRNAERCPCARSCWGRIQPPESPSYPSPIHTQSSPTHQEVCPNQEVTQ